MHLWERDVIERGRVNIANDSEDEVNLTIVQLTNGNVPNVVNELIRLCCPPLPF